MEGGFALGVSDCKDGEKMGKAEGCSLAMHANIDIGDIKKFCDDPHHSGAITGHIDFTPFGENIPAKNGVFNLFCPSHDPDMKLMVYELGFEHDGKDYYVAGKKEVKDDPGFDLWSDTTTLYTTLHEGKDSSGPIIGSGVLRLGVGELIKLIQSMTAPNAGTLKEKAECVSAFGTFFLGRLWVNYAKMAKKA
ncbi:MAG: hypothetical protein ACE5I1_10500 [bacterium]